MEKSWKIFLQNCRNPVYTSKPIFKVRVRLLEQGCKFSDFCLISENFASKYLKVFLKFHLYNPFRWFYDKFRFLDKVSVSFQIFSVNFTYIPA